MRVTPDRQTLILAGEAPPRRSLANPSLDDLDSQPISGSQRVTIISARLDASMIVTQSDYTPVPTVVAYDSGAAWSRGSSYNAASAYARTRDLTDRLPIIDTYA